MTGSIVSPATRDRVRGFATPVAELLGRLGLTPNALTIIGFLGTCVAAFAAAQQWWLAGGILVLVFGIFDLFDGTLARATGRASRFGAFLDSTLDRAGEVIVYVGIALGCLAGSFDTGAVLAAAAMGAAFMVSYTRAKAENLGFTSGTGMAAIGLAPREVRTALLGAGLIVAGLLPPMWVGDACHPIGAASWNCLFGAGGLSEAAWVLTATLGLITILATITTIQRILHVRAQAVREG